MTKNNLILERGKLYQEEFGTLSFSFKTKNGLSMPKHLHSKNEIIILALNDVTFRDGDQDQEEFYLKTGKDIFVLDSGGLMATLISLKFGFRELA